MEEINLKLRNQFVRNSLVDLCSWESLCHLRQDCCHHFVSERNFRRDTQRVCQAERSLMSRLAETKRAAKD